MEEGRIVDTAMMNNCELELPEPIIQHVQSFLTGKKAARTIILSKSWHNAWLTRPNLHFDESDFPYRNYYEKNPTEFLALAKKTIQRNEYSNLKIESFDLCLQSVSKDNFGLVNILIVKALKLCASHLCFELEKGCPEKIVIAREVFESENLVGLSLKGCGIEIGMDFNVRCHKLESLCLTSVELIENHDVLPKIILSCPLIQNLSLSSKERCKSIPINLPRMHNLKCLTLQHVVLDSFFFYDLSSKFRARKILTMDGIYRSDDNPKKEEVEMQIFSRSLERLNLSRTYPTSMFKLDVPSVKKLVIKTCWIPSVSFVSTSKELESHASVSLEHIQPLEDNEWFPALNKLLIALSPSSSIEISIDGGCDKCFDYEVRVNQGLRKHSVKNLNLNIEFLPSLICYVLFGGLFRFGRPKFITHQYQYLDPNSQRSRTNINDFLSKQLEQGTKGVFSSPDNIMYGLNDLKEVYVQFFYEDDDVADLPWKPLIEVNEASEIISLDTKQKTRYQLVWKS